MLATRGWTHHVPSCPLSLTRYTTLLCVPRGAIGDTGQDLAQLTASVVSTMCAQLSGSPDLAWLWPAETPETTPTSV